jgi:hypothetical protein
MIQEFLFIFLYHDTLLRMMKTLRDREMERGSMSLMRDTLRCYGKVWVSEP